MAFTWKIIEGDYEGRQVWQTLCYQHSNSMTQDIARKFLKNLCVALDLTEQVTNPETFKFKPVKVRIVVEVDKRGQYDDQNRIRRVLPLTNGDGEAMETKTHSPKPDGGASEAKIAPKPATNGPGAAPWKRPTAQP